jgi:hypothetical protein
MRIIGWTKADLNDVVETDFEDDNILIGGDGSAGRLLEPICNEVMHKWCMKNGDCASPGKPRCKKITITVNFAAKKEGG